MLPATPRQATEGGLKRPGRRARKHRDNPMRVFKDPAGKYLERWDLLRLYVAIGSAASASTGWRVQECVRTIADRASRGVGQNQSPFGPAISSDLRRRVQLSCRGRLHHACSNRLADSAGPPRRGFDASALEEHRYCSASLRAVGHL